MERETFKLQFRKLYDDFTTKSIPESFSLKDEVTKKLLNFFLVGDSFFFIVNHHNCAVELVSKEIEDVMGCLLEDFQIHFLNDRIHPDDRSWFLMIGKAIMEFFAQLPIEKFMKYKTRYDIRVIKGSGDVARMLFQGMVLEHDQRGLFIRTLNVQTDINYLKRDGIPTLSFIGMDGEPSYLDVLSKNVFMESTETFSRRERQVLQLLMQGKLSKEISDILCISKQTVDTHRKNMLRKHNFSSTGELVGKAVKNGWI